jgi:hypothetical protein
VAEPPLDPLAERLLEGVADPGGKGLLLRGEETTPLRLSDLPEGSPLRETGETLVRLALVAERAAELLRDHPDSAVRHSAAVLAAQAHPLLEGLAVEPD